MRIKAHLFIFLCFICIATVTAQTQSFAAKVGPDSVADQAEQLLPAVVNISSTQKVEDPQDFPEIPELPEGSPFHDFFEEFMGRRGHGGQGGVPAIPPASLGSGFVIDAEKGYIVTNAHVVRDADEVRVTFHDDSTVEAEVIGKDDKTDIAVLKVETDQELIEVGFGDSDEMRVGDWIMAIGNPFGLGGTVTVGIISARARDINAGPYDDFLQTDASINRGNSGGPMFDMEGEVIGINTAIFSPSGGSVGIGFAIPSSLAEPVIEQIIRYGRTRRGWLGVRIQKVTEEIAESLDLEEPAGALVASVTADGPAEKAGLEAGDIIMSFNGEDIEDMRDLPRIVAETEIQSDAQVVFWREGKEKKVRVKIGELEKAEEEGLLASGPSEESKALEIETVGLHLLELNDDLKEDYGVPASVEGVLIDHVEPLSEAAKKGLMEGDVIVEINQQAVSDPIDVKDVIRKAKKAKRRSVLLLVNKEGDVRFVALRLK